MKASGYGGSDTDKNDGVQPAPHSVDMVGYEKLRKLMRSGDPADPLSGSDIVIENG